MAKSWLIDICDTSSQRQLVIKDVLAPLRRVPVYRHSSVEEEGSRIRRIQVTSIS